MAFNIDDINRFQHLFANAQTAYGTFTENDTTDESGKLRGQAQLVKHSPSTTTFAEHLNGQKSMGLAPINETGSCLWGAIDIDNYPDHEFKYLIKAIYDFNIPLVPCYSKSKKVHLFIFFLEPVPAAKVQTMLQRYAVMLGCPPKTEIFPKQNANSVTVKQQYSWINLPYFGDTRKLIGWNMEEIPFQEFISRSEEMQMKYNLHVDLQDSIPYADAPPCIQVGALLRDFTSESHCRNNFLFSASVYLRMKEIDDIETVLTDLNNSFAEPIEEERLRGTVFSGLKKNTYFYLCKDMRNCNKEYCRKTDFGIDSKLSTGLDFGPIEQWIDDPPYYSWMVNGQKLIFYSESDIMQQHKFREQVYRALHIMPRKVDDKRWTQIINKSTQDKIVHEAAVTEGGFSSGSQFLSHTISFFYDRRPATDLSQLQLGRTYVDTTSNMFIFSAGAYMSYLRNVKDFRVYSSIEVQTKLSDLGAIQAGNYWKMPVNSIPKPDRSDVVIDFHDVEQEGDLY